jgi:hypothetical protein
MSGPLGAKGGLHLYNGASTKDPLLAAAGEDLPFSRVYNLLQRTSRVWLPGLGSGGGLVPELMRAHTTADGHVAWRFSIEVGAGEKMRREAFEWRKVKKSERDESTTHGGFKLVSVSADDGEKENGSAGKGDESGGRGTSIDGEDHDALAIFSWKRFLTSPKHPFDLTLLGDGLPRTMGDRWTLMVLMTALRLWMLHLHGKTNLDAVAIAEKAGGEGKGVV